MSGETKMIIITSDEDIIRQFAFNTNQNTHIIPLESNNGKIIEIGQNGNSTINLNFVPKPTTDTSDRHQLKAAKARKKSADLACIICGDRAIGYNYAVHSCASCKAFFHRNGQQDLVSEFSYAFYLM